jgi:ketosteroid isomerase-like protein
MSEREASRPVNLPGAKTSADPDPTLAAPAFDQNSIHAARAAVPLASEPGGRASRSWSLPLVALAVLAGLVGGALGIFAINLYQKRAATQATRADTQNAGATGGATPDVAPPQTHAQGATHAAGANDDAAAARESQAADGQSGAADEKRAGVDEKRAGSGRAAAGDGKGELRAALGEWIGATNARDIDRQMSFYDARLDAFYLARGASREAVRDEKARVFSRAATVEVRADEPQIDLSADGQTATMRFRKQFNIEGGGSDKRGAVVQELRWRRTPAGWKITSERDLRVVN